MQKCSSTYECNKYYFHFLLIRLKQKIISQYTSYLHHVFKFIMQTLNITTPTLRIILYPLLYRNRMRFYSLQVCSESHSSVTLISSTHDRFNCITYYTIAFMNACEYLTTVTLLSEIRWLSAHDTTPQPATSQRQHVWLLQCASCGTELMPILHY